MSWNEELHQPKTTKRRTPRGTSVEPWMSKVNSQMEQRGSRRGSS